MLVMQLGDRFDPVDAGEAPPPRDPRAMFTALAVKHGLIRDGDKLDQNMVDFATDIVGACADIGDEYGDDEAGGNAGEHIRARLRE
ncbi:MAG: hypothetical protein EOO81_03690 [Oxalobacteraceae bacterium]|nr:MAG: hypothetical protein EOO81_03690 [Oxalobacteraceae bacterium]